MRLNEFTNKGIDTSKKGEELDEAGTLDRYRDRIGTSGQSDRYRDRQERRHERDQEYDDASHQSRLNRLAADDQNYASWRQNQSDRDAHRTTRMQKDDDDWEKTFDMMRDRLNRYQWSSQRDVDPEQLAAISNIKYEPRKKNEAVQGNLMAVSPEHWQKSVLARYPTAIFRQQKMMNGATIAIDNNKEVGFYDPKTNYSKVGPTTEQGVAEGAGNIGNAIKSLYQKIYNAGDDEIEYFYNASPIFAQYWDEYEGDLDSIIAEVDPKELQVMLAELETYAEDAGLAEAGNNYHANRTGFAKPSGHRDDERHDLDVARPLIYGLKINGKIWQKDGNTVTFFTKERALAARNSILAKRPELEIGLVQRPQD